MAVLIDGRAISRIILDKCKREILDIKSKLPQFNPTLAIVQVGERQDSNIYIKNKIKVAADIGININHYKYNSNVTENELLGIIYKLNRDQNIHGVIVQLPIISTSRINPDLIIHNVDPSKDVDGLHYVNAGKLFTNVFDNAFVPCAPRGIMELIKSTGTSIVGKNSVVVGRGRLVGAPVANLLSLNNATVTTCHSKSENIDQICQKADILIVAIGKARHIKANWVKEGAIVIDCGVNSFNNEGICGDVDFDDVRHKASFITPVPGGLGPMTVCMLLLNTFESAKRYYQKYIISNNSKIKI